MNIKLPNGPRNSPRSIRSKYTYTQDNCNDISEIIESILEGLSLDKIHPNLFEDLYPQLSSKYKEFVDRGSSKNASVIKEAMNYIENYSAKSNNSSGSSSPIALKIDFDVPEEDDMTEKDREHLNELKEYQIYLAEREEKRKDQLNFTPEEMALGVQLVLDEDYENLDRRLIKKLIPELRRLQKQSVKNCKYKDAGKYFEAARKLEMLTTSFQYERMTADKAMELETKVLNMNFDLARLKQEWNAKIESAKIQLENDINLLVKEQNERLEEFDQQFQSDEIPITYCKYSGIVSDLKKKKEYLLSANRFEEAAEMHERIEKQKRDEERGFLDKYHQDLTLKREAFISQIEKKIASKQEQAQFQIDSMTNQKKKQVDQYKKALKRLQIKSQEAEELSLTAMTGCPSHLNSRTTSKSPSQIGNSTFSSSMYMSARGNKSSRSNWTETVGSKRSRAKSQRSNGNSRSLRNTGSGFPTSNERTSEELFRQRRAINSIIYTRTSLKLPKIHKQ